MIGEIDRNEKEEAKKGQKNQEKKKHRQQSCHPHLINEGLSAAARAAGSFNGQENALSQSDEGMLRKSN